MGFKNKDLGELAQNLAPNAGDEAWVSDHNQPTHTHANGEQPHADGYHITNTDGTAKYEKYHGQ